VGGVGVAVGEVVFDGVVAGGVVAGEVAFDGVVEAFGDPGVVVLADDGVSAAFVPVVAGGGVTVVVAAIVSAASVRVSFGWSVVVTLTFAVTLSFASPGFSPPPHDPSSRAVSGMNRAVVCTRMVSSSKECAMASIVAACSMITIRKTE
jgi:hypothetical protein